MTTGQYYVSGAFFIEANAPAGAGASKGTLFASNDSTLLKTGAGLNWDAITGYEITIGAQAGTGVNNKTGMTIVQWDTDRVAGNAGHDYAYGMAAQGTCAGWDVGYAIGNGYGWWPMKATGTLIGTIPPNPGGPAYAAAWGIDFSAVAFSGGLIRGPVFSVNSAGKIASSAGVAMGSATVSAATDLSRHLDLYNGQFGMCVASSGALNIVTQGSGLGIYVAGALQGAFNATGLQMPVGQGTAYPGAFTTLTASGAVSGAGFVTLLAPYATTANVAAAYLALAGGTLSGGLQFGSATVTTDTNLTRHLDLYGGNYGMSVANSGSMNVVANSGINVYVNAARVGVFTGTGLDATVIGATAPSAGTFTTVQTGSTVGPTWTTGSAAPAATAPVGSLYSRVGGAVGATLYVSRGSGTWAAVAGV
jgi:hypothetical protein